MDAIKNMLERKSIRKYLDKAVEEEKLHTVMDCALHAPTAKNAQNRLFTVITNAQKRDELAEAMKLALGRESYDLFKAPVLVVITVPRDSDNGAVDTANAIQNIYLATHDLGLGACWINQLKDVCDDAGVRKVLTSFGIPEDHVNYGMISFGYPADDPSPRERTEKVNYIK